MGSAIRLEGPVFRRAHNSENVHRDTGRKSDLGRRVSDSLVTDQQSLRFQRLEMIVKVCTVRKHLINNKSNNRFVSEG